MSYKCVTANAGAISPTNYDLLAAQEELQKIKNFFLTPDLSIKSLRIFWQKKVKRMDH